MKVGRNEAPPLRQLVKVLELSPQYAAARIPAKHREQFRIAVKIRSNDASSPHRRGPTRNDRSVQTIHDGGQRAVETEHQNDAI